MDPNDPKYAPAAIATRQNHTIGVTVAMSLIGALAVSLRVYTRAHIVGQMWVEDWVMVATLVFAFGYAIEIFVAVREFDAGFSGMNLSPSDIVGLIKVCAGWRCSNYHRHY
jgi:hypothetical protein